MINDDHNQMEITMIFGTIHSTATDTTKFFYGDNKTHLINKMQAYTVTYHQFDLADDADYCEEGSLEENRVIFAWNPKDRFIITIHP